MKKLPLQNNELQQKSQEEKTHAAQRHKTRCSSGVLRQTSLKKPHTDTNGQAAWILAVEPFTKPGMKITASGAKAMQMYDFHA